jgi:phosphoglycolate phosphatase-like HAD superfamily hydrolase
VAIRHLIWDLDGTLFDSYPALTEAVGAALGELGVTVPLKRIESLAKKSMSHCASTLADDFQMDPEDLMQRFEEHYRSTPVSEQPPFPGVTEVCGFICSIGGTNVIVTHRMRKSATRLLRAHRMLSYFADILAGDEGYPRKPDPAMFEVVIRRQSLEREETLAIGDRDIDVLAGRAAGVRTCLYRAGSSEVKSDYRITDYAELRQIIIRG